MLKDKKKLYLWFKMFLLLVVIANVVSTIYLLHENDINTQKYIPRISYLLAEAIDNESKPTVIDPQTNDIYLPDAKLVLPQTPKNIGTVAYNYIPSYNNVPNEIQVVNLSDVDMAKQGIINGQNLKAIYSAVPKAQACASGISIYYQTQSGQDLAYTRKLANGRTIYLYTQPNCPDSSFLRYVEQINSY